MKIKSKKISICVLIFTLLLFISILLIFLFNNSNESNEKNEEHTLELDRKERDALERMQDEEIRKNKETKEQQEKNKDESNKENNLIKQKEEYFKEKEIKEKEHKEKYLKEKNELDEKLIKLGFVKNNNCYNITEDKDICYSNNIYEVVIRERDDISFTKNIDKNNLINYDCKSDLSFIGDLLDNNELSKHSNYTCKLINMIGKHYSNSFNIEIDGLYFYISDYSDKLRYNISLASYSDIFYPSDINAIINKSDTEDSYIVKQEIYDLAMIENKKFFYYYDYINMYFNKNSNNICNINYHNNEGYTMESSFCHGGTSNTYYQFDYYKFDKEKYNSITNNIKGAYFKEMYLNIISNDLNYFSKKLNSTIELNDYNKQLLTKFVNNNELDISLNINDTIKINIKYYPNYYFKNYKIEYILQ